MYQKTQKVMDMVSDSTLQLTSKKQTFVKEKYPQLSENAIRILITFQTTCLCEVGYFYIL